MERKFGFIQIGNYFFNLDKIESIKVNIDNDIVVYCVNDDAPYTIYDYRNYPRAVIVEAINSMLFNFGYPIGSLGQYLSGGSIK